MLAFSNKIMFVGFGSVARCTLPILLKHIRVDEEEVFYINTSIELWDPYAEAG
jgi:homospermidine synthase